LDAVRAAYWAGWTDDCWAALSADSKVASMADQLDERTVEKKAASTAGRWAAQKAENSAVH